jgi:hypothetical protein
MGNTQLPFHQCRSFINPSQQHVAEVERPDPIIDLFEADAMLAKRGREVQQLGLEANGTGVGDALHDEVVGVFERGQCAGIRARRGAIAGAWRPAAKELVGPLVVVFLPKAVEGPLLGGEGRPRGPARRQLDLPPDDN